MQLTESVKKKADIPPGSDDPSGNAIAFRQAQDILNFMRQLKKFNKNTPLKR